MFYVCTTGETAHIDTMLKFLPHTRQNGCIDILNCCNDPCLQVSEVTWQMVERIPGLQFPLICSDYAANWPETVQRHLQRLMGDHLISACTDTQFQ
jgi:hypothetical protein